MVGHRWMWIREDLSKSGCVWPRLSLRIVRIITNPLFAFEMDSGRATAITK